jgi:hypothetical protein
METSEAISLIDGPVIFAASAWTASLSHRYGPGKEIREA